jgi:hypothetical protein
MASNCGFIENNSMPRQCRDGAELGEKSAMDWTPSFPPAKKYKGFLSQVVFIKQRPNIVSTW